MSESLDRVPSHHSDMTILIPLPYWYFYSNDNRLEFNSSLSNFV